MPTVWESYSGIAIINRHNSPRKKLGAHTHEHTVGMRSSTICVHDSIMKLRVKSTDFFFKVFVDDSLFIHVH